ncbi:MAG TPA: hypothetical protein VHV78_10325, partial [Gemmatimonadaceae bacterium]|nr:hypothetical protein [Gemmatimonadaceae bacterium]
IVRALMLGAPFWVAIHVVLVGTLQSYGLVRRQLTVELLGLAFVVLGCGGCLVARTPLWIVAAAGSGAAVIAWSIGVALVQRWISGARAQPIRRFVPIVLAQSAAVLLALSLHWHWIEQSVLYVALALAPTFLAARAARRHGW